MLLRSTLWGIKQASHSEKKNAHKIKVHTDSPFPKIFNGFIWQVYIFIALLLFLSWIKSNAAKKKKTKKKKRANPRRATRLNLILKAMPAGSWDKLFIFCEQSLMNVFSFLWWNKYFHSVKDEMFHYNSVSPRWMEHFIFHLMKIFVPLHS